MTRSVRTVLADATTTLAGSGIDSPQADAQWLLAHVLGIPRGRLVLVDDLDEETARRFDTLVAARGRRVPLQHLIGSVVFGPVELAVGPGVFVPRPETELLYEWAVSAVGDRLAHNRTSAPSDEATTITVVDLCSGSGALAIALAVRLPAARVHAVEISAAAVTWLRRNVERAGVGDRVHIHLGDATDGDAVSGFLDGPADLVVANPPYVPRTTTVSPEVGADPEAAVFGGADGMSVIVPMVDAIAQILRPGAPMGIEHDDSTAHAVVDAVTATGEFDRPDMHTDLAGRPRFVTAKRR